MTWATNGTIRFCSLNKRTLISASDHRSGDHRQFPLAKDDKEWHTKYSTSGYINERFLTLVPVFLGLVGCAAVPVSDGMIAVHSPRAAYDALVARCQQPTTLTRIEYDVVCFPGAQPDYLDCVVPKARPRYSCDIEVHAQALSIIAPC